LDETEEAPSVDDRKGHRVSMLRRWFVRGSSSGGQPLIVEADSVTWYVAIEIVGLVGLFWFHWGQMLLIRWGISEFLLPEPDPHLRRDFITLLFIVMLLAPYLAIIRRHRYELLPTHIRVRRRFPRIYSRLSLIPTFDFDERLYYLRLIDSISNLPNGVRLKFGRRDSVTLRVSAQFYRTLVEAWKPERDAHLANLPMSNAGPWAKEAEARRLDPQDHIDNMRKLPGDSETALEMFRY